MKEMEKKKKGLIERLDFLKTELRKRYELAEGSGIRFLTENGGVFFLTALIDDNAIVVEYAESHEEAALNRFEDGDLFFVDDLSEEEMLAAIIREIEAE